MTKDCANKVSRSFLNGTEEMRQGSIDRAGHSIGILAGCLLLMAVMVSATASKTSFDYSRTPVLFVHGHGMSTSTWDDMMAYLIRTGYPREYLLAVAIDPNTMPNARAATKVLEPAAQSLLEKARAAARLAGVPEGGPRRLAIVSHSMGAVSSRWYAARLHPELVRIWISLGGANHGTKVLCLFPDEAAREICPAFAASSKESAVQVVLNGTPDSPIDETPYGLGVDRGGVPRVSPDQARNIVYFTVRIEPDSWIKPEQSALLDGAGGGQIAIPSGVPAQETSPGNFLFRAQVEHDPLPSHPDLIRLVAALLSVRGTN